MLSPLPRLFARVLPLALACLGARDAALYGAANELVLGVRQRKNTKVEFPEARIYEETLNCLLYENRTGPDQDLMQVLDFSNPQVPIPIILNPRQPVQEALELLTRPTTRMSRRAALASGTPSGHRGARVTPLRLPRLARPRLRLLLVGQLRLRLRVRRRS